MRFRCIDSFVECVLLAEQFFLAVKNFAFVYFWLEVDDSTKDQWYVFGHFGEGVLLLFASEGLDHLVHPVLTWDLDLLCILGKVKFNLGIHRNVERSPFVPFIGIVIVEVQNKAHELLHLTWNFDLFLVEPDGATEVQVQFNLVVIFETYLRHL